KIQTDKPRVKTQVNGVPTGGDKGQTFAPADLQVFLLANNPVFKTVQLADPPYWMRASENFKETDYSSFVLSFHNREDAKKVYVKGKLIIAGRGCTLKPHTPLLPTPQCKHCWKFGHHISICKENIQCCKCSGPHPETSH
ncbi:hypothetical protein F5876DRAFT_3922, partial [Lentinula aff. lateritia]